MAYQNKLKAHCKTLAETNIPGMKSFSPDLLENEILEIVVSYLSTEQLLTDQAKIGKFYNFLSLRTS